MATETRRSSSPPASLRSRGLAKWLLGAALMLDIGVLLFVLSLANVTAEGSAKRSLGYSAAILAEVDTYLDDHYDALRQQAQSSNEPVELPDALISVTFTPDEISTTDRDSFRALLLSRWADVLYDEGSPALHESRGADISFFSTEGLVRSGMDFLRPTPHRVLNIMTIVLAVLAGILAAGLAWATRGYGRLLALGLSVLLAALPFFVFAVAIRFAFRVAAEGVDDYLASEVLRLGQELAWAAIRDGLIFTVGSAVVLVGAAGLARWSDARRPS